MRDVVIQVENLSKQYRIHKGSKTARYQTLRDTLMNISSTSINWLRRAGKDSQENIFWALKDVFFEVKRGEVLGVIGHNGAGKSTLLKILSRITQPTHGAVDLYGRVGSLLEVGTGFHPELSGRENIFLNGAILGMKRAEINLKFDQVVNFAEVEKFVDTPVKYYSSGMYLRLAFSVAAHLNPEILLVDEVLAVGDAAFQKKCLGKMGEVAKDGRTVLFVSHNMAAINALCDRGILLEQGKVVYCGDIKNTVYSYTHAISTDSKNDRTSNNYNVDYSEITILNMKDQEIGLISPGEGFKISSKLLIKKAIDSFDFYLVIKNSDDDLILVSRANNKHFAMIREPGSYHFSLIFPALWLMPGQYNCHFKIIEYSTGMGQIRHFSRDFILDVVSLDIIPDVLLGRLAPAVDWSISLE
jgi:lipopolysaccharide transport system ATP-binding protein